MYKNIIRTAFLFATGIFMTACSSGDDELADSRTIVTPDTKENTVTLTGTISTGSDITRAVDTDGKTVYWEVGDEICVQYKDKDDNYATVKGTITYVDNSTVTKKAKFTATLTNLAPNSTTNSIGLAYPYSNVIAGKATSVTNFAINETKLAKQVGTIDGINNAKLDVAWTTTAVGITIDKATATLDNDADLSNQVCICKFNIKDGEDALNARMLEITTGTKTTPDYIVTPADEQSTFYVVLPEISGKLKIEASTCGDNGAMKLDSENKLKAMKSSDVGSYISIDPNEGTDQYQAYLCKNLTSGSPASTTAKICSHTYTNANLAKDKFYTKDLTTTPIELTPIAVVSSVGAVTGYWDYFLALAINDVPTSGTVTLGGGHDAVNSWVASHIVKINGQTYNSFNNAAYDQVAPNTDASQASSWSPSKTASATVPAKWRVPSVTDWRYIIQSFDGGRDATDPKGVMDYNGTYPGESYPGYTSPVGATGAVADLFSKINTACGNSDLQSIVYWTSSQYEYTPTTEPYTPVMKTWRWDFAYGYFVWNSGDDTARIRLVLAY